MSTCCYDTAWMIMISKETDEKGEWLCPSSFDYPIGSQTHPAVIRFQSSVQRTLRHKLEVLILTHIMHAEYNTRFRSQSLAQDRTMEFATPCSSYYFWVHSTSADLTSFPYSFHFLSCLVVKLGSLRSRESVRGIWQRACADSTMTVKALFGIERRRIRPALIFFPNFVKRTRRKMRIRRQLRGLNKTQG